MSRLPLIGVTNCPTQTVLLAASDILDGLDGIFFTGSPSNIEPFHPGGPANVLGIAHDSARASTILLTHATVEAGICARPWQWQSVPSDADASNNA